MELTDDEVARRRPRRAPRRPTFRDERHESLVGRWRLADSLHRHSR